MSLSSNISPSASSRPLEGKIALVTGASRGIGAAIAKRYGAAGAHVILVGRTMGGLEEVDDAIQQSGSSATIVPLDLKEGDKIDQLGSIIAGRFGKLDILVGNAAILGKLSPLGHISPSLWDEVITTNLTANWRLIRSLDPLLRASEAGRAIFVTSGITHIPTAYWGAYATSKAGLEMLVKTYAEEVKITSVRVNLIDPGIVRTKMRATAMPGENPETLPLPEAITDKFLEVVLPTYSNNGKIIAV